MLQSFLRPIYRWVWSDATRRGRKLLSFSAVEADGGRDIARAAELTSDPLLRRLYLVHARDEERHAELFRSRGVALLTDGAVRAPMGAQSGWLAPGERGLDDVRVDDEPEDSLLAFLHLSEKSAARDFAAYRDVLDHDPSTKAVFEEILHDETFHMRYTYVQLGRIAPRRRGWLLWKARLSRLWKAYLRLAAGLAGVIGTVILTIQYFVIAPPFAMLARRSQAREPVGWSPVNPGRTGGLKRQY